MHLLHVLGTGQNPPRSSSTVLKSRCNHAWCTLFMWGKNFLYTEELTAVPNSSVGGTANGARNMDLQIHMDQHTSKKEKLNS